ncbi:MAG: hypothetical protein KC656_15870 [Myxococcales bacterium]|nr:hypothetical protein [Myxococcales bacterium]
MWLLMAWAWASTVEVSGPCAVAVVDVDTNGLVASSSIVSGAFGTGRFPVGRAALDLLGFADDYDAGVGLGVTDVLVVLSSARPFDRLMFVFPMNTWTEGGSVAGLDLASATAVFTLNTTSTSACGPALADSVRDLTHVTPVERAAEAANAAYPTGSPISPSAPTRLRPATLESTLQVPTDLLVSEGCEVGTRHQWVGGAYRAGQANGVVGEQALGYPLQGRAGGGLVAGDRDGDLFGDRIGAFDGPRFVANLPSAGSFLFGISARVQGARGVFVGAEATCPLAASPESALASWFHGDLSGLDGDVVLEGAWTVSSPDCGDFSTTWTFIPNDEPLYWDIPELGGVATVIGPSTFDIVVPGGGLQITVTGDTFTGSTPACQFDGVRQ